MPHTRAQNCVFVLCKSENCSFERGLLRVPFIATSSITTLSPLVRAARFNSRSCIEIWYFRILFSKFNQFFLFLFTNFVLSRHCEIVLHKSIHIRDKNYKPHIVHYQFKTEAPIFCYLAFFFTFNVSRK